MLSEFATRPPRWRALRRIVVWISLSVNLIIIVGIISFFIWINIATAARSPKNVSDIGCPRGLTEDMSISHCVPDGKVHTSGAVSETVLSSITNQKLRQAYKNASKGNKDAQRFLAAAYLRGTKLGKDEKLAHHWFTKAAVQGDSESQLALSIMFAKGMGATVDKVEALRWLKEAALRNHALAQSLYGKVLIKGTAVKRDRKDGLKWLERAKRNRAKQRLLKTSGA